ELLSRVLDAHPEFEFVQLQINYLDWRAQRANEYYKIAHERGLPILVMEPVKGGSLANLVPGAAALSPHLATPAMQAAFALKFAASLDGVMTVLSGMTTPEQVEANVRTFQTPSIRGFDDEDMRLADRVLEETRKISQVPCTECGYCLDACPVGIEIPKIFAIYNEFKRGGAAFHAQYLYSCIKNGHRADSCIKCGACVEKCPQGIDIPTELEALHPELPLLPLVPEGTK
ncbi:4Fe-4S dicluster domain-containing protein, partial [Synergistaceae bacterium OttesenSCG-928-I11]|nr:4Fe-4S dicluster domain-containing protein [Synergistaceae bacterium OttesenSCG-928-I11]